MVPGRRASTDRRVSAARLALGACLLFGAVVLTRRLRTAVARARSNARDVPLSPLLGDRRIGADWPERRGIVTDERPVGEVDDLDVFARPDFDPAAVHPAVRRFYERTGEYDLHAVVTWHRGFRVGAALATRLTSRIQQLDLPGPWDDGTLHLRSRLAGVRPDADPREGARAWVRTDARTGEAVFVAVYATHERGGERYSNVAVPLPWSNLSTVLHVDAFDGTAAGSGVELTTRAPGDPGLYLVTPAGAVSLPLAQRFRVWPADAPGAPADPTSGEAVAVATHEMWVFDRQFLTIRYGVVRETVV